MIDMAFLSVIRRWRFREGMAIREIARRTGISRNTIKKYLKSGDVEPQYQSRKAESKLDDFEKTLSEWLKLESTKPRKQKRSVKQLYEDLILEGYTGSYDRVAAFARGWRQQQRDHREKANRRAYVPLVYAPGEAFQFDWSEDFANIDGKQEKLQVAHFKLCHSRAFYIRAYPLQTHEMLFDAHNHAFAFLGGVPKRGIYDNMKTAVDKLGRGKERVVNARFQAMASHYLYDVDFCNAASGWEKGQVEKDVRDSRHRIWQKIPDFKNLSDLNTWLESECNRLWSEITHPSEYGKSIAEVWCEEKRVLMEIPKPFDGFVEHSKRVSPTCLVTFDRNKYSVPGMYANRRVSLRVYADSIQMVAEDKIVAQHDRVFSKDRKSGSGRIIYDWRHYLPVIERKPGALRNGEPFTTLPTAFKKLQSILSKRSGGNREMVEILSLVLQHDELLVEQAVEEALCHEKCSKQHVMNCLSRLLEPSLPPQVMPPEGLEVSQEPTSNTERYDRLREVCCE